jgi:putative membrane protein
MSRPGLIVDLTYTATLLAPVVTLLSVRLARARHFAAHRAIQLGLLAVCFLTVLAFEGQVRLAGGSGAFVGGAAPAWRALARRLLLVHVTFAVATYLMWGFLAIASVRRYRGTLPGSFSRRHRRLGRIVLAGLTFTALSATGMYVLVFVV